MQWHAAHDAMPRATRACVCVCVLMASTCMHASRRFDNPPDWQEILTHFRGSELQNYFSRILEDNLKTLIKPQYVDHIPKAVKGKVGDIVR